MTPQQEQALKIASAVTVAFENFDATARMVADAKPLSMETIRMLTTYEVFHAALRVLEGPEPRAEA